MRNIVEKQETLAELKGQLEYWEIVQRDLEYQIANFEVDTDDFEDDFCRMLDEMYEEIKLGSGTYSYSSTYKEMNETGFNCDLADYANGIDKDECREYVNLTEELEEADNKIEELEYEIEELEISDEKEE